MVGAGGFGRVVHEHISLKYNCAFIDDGIKIGTIIDGVEVIGTTHDLKKLRENYDNLLVTIGNNTVRESIYNNSSKWGYFFPNLVHKSAFISKHAKIGHGCIVLNNAVIQSGASIGNGVIISPGVEIHHDSSIGDNALIYTNTVVRSLARVGKRAHIGSTLTISNEVIIPDDGVIIDGQTVLK